MLETVLAIMMVLGIYIVVPIIIAGIIWGVIILKTRVGEAKKTHH